MGEIVGDIWIFLINYFYLECSQHIKPFNTNMLLLFMLFKLKENESMKKNINHNGVYMVQMPVGQDF